MIVIHKIFIDANMGFRVASGMVDNNEFRIAIPDDILDEDTTTFVESELTTSNEIDDIRITEELKTNYRWEREYPSIGDQLDDLFKAGAFSSDMSAKIQAVKDANPKPI
jgi:hypothetical protein